MAKSIVGVAGCSLALGEHGTYRLVCWHRLVEGRMQQADYTELSWTEAIDVILAELHGRRPGFEVGDGWYQPPLF